MSQRNAADLMKKSALDRLLGYARLLAYPDRDRIKSRGVYSEMQQTAVTLDGLQAAVVDYDKILEIIEQDREQAEGYAKIALDMARGDS